MRYFEKLRLTWITTRLREVGQIQRKDLIEHFGISVPQASKDINKYLVLYPAAMVYDRHRKRYMAAPRPEVQPVPELTSGMADAFAAIERHPLEPNILFMSIDSLQQFRPDLTDEVLAESDILRGRDFVMIHNKTIQRGVEI